MTFEPEVLAVQLCVPSHHWDRLRSDALGLLGQNAVGSVSLLPSAVP